MLNHIEELQAFAAQVPRVEDFTTSIWHSCNHDFYIQRPGGPVLELPPSSFLYTAHPRPYKETVFLGSPAVLLGMNERREFDNLGYTAAIAAHNETCRSRLADIMAIQDRDGCSAPVTDLEMHAIILGLTRSSGQSPTLTNLVSLAVKTYYRIFH